MTNRVKLPQTSFIPASIPMGPTLYSPRLSYKENKISWYDDESFFTYPSMLLSTYYGINFPDIRMKFNIPEEIYLFGDSGGFQNLSLGANLSPLKVLRWQEKNCNVGFTFDIPLNENDNTNTIRKKQIKTVENAYYMLSNRSNENLKLYAVIQARTDSDRKFIIEEYRRKNIDNFDGFGIGSLVANSTKPFLLSKILLNSVYHLLDYKKPIHFFGISGYKTIPIILYLQEKSKLRITFDSSSYSSGSRLRGYYINQLMSEIYFPDSKLSKLSEFPCTCPVCLSCKPNELVKVNNSIVGGLLSLHNLFQVIEFTRVCSSLVKDKNLFEKFADMLKISKCIEYIDYAFEEGIEDANKKFGKIRRTNQKTIFD